MKLRGDLADVEKKLLFCLLDISQFVCIIVRWAFQIIWVHFIAMGQYNNQWAAYELNDNFIK
jgi:hypothetical protein